MSEAGARHIQATAQQTTHAAIDAVDMEATTETPVTPPKPGDPPTIPGPKPPAIPVEPDPKPLPDPLPPGTPHPDQEPLPLPEIEPPGPATVPEPLPM